jgi:hypothetical protein
VSAKLRDAALELAKAGVRVFPCLKTKAPATPNGFHDATTNPETIRSWTWDGMIGAVVRPGTVIIDVDPRNGGDATLAALREAGRALPPTYTVQTGGGGQHYYLTVPEDAHLRGKLGPGVDVKKAGKGYVIVPPSKGYTVLSHEPQADAPPWLMAELRVERVDVEAGEGSEPKFFPYEEGTPYGLAALEREMGRLLTAQEGGRNDALNRAAFNMAQIAAGGEISRKRAITDLATVAPRIGLSVEEAQATIESGWAAGLRVPRQARVKVEALNAETFGVAVHEPRPEGEAVAITDPDDPEAEGRYWLDWNIEEPEPPFLCHPLLPANAYVLVYGATEAAKSMTWLGLLCQGSHKGIRSSIYSLENPGQTDRSRLRRWRPDPRNLRLTNQPIDFNDARQVGRLVEREKEWGADVILIDTYSHAFNSRSEDGNAKAIEFARRVRHVMREVGCSVVVLDHTGFVGDEPRDASAKRQQVDVAILMEKRGEWRAGEPARFAMTNRKSARFGNPFRYNGEIRDTKGDIKGLALGWEGTAPRWVTE